MEGTGARAAVADDHAMPQWRLTERRPPPSKRGKPATLLW
jgi:hypothetical protein